MLTTTQHYTVENLGSSLRFTLPYRKSWARSLVIILVLLGSPLLPLSFIFQPTDLTRQLPLPFIVFAMISWATLAILMVVELLWFALGLEVAEVDDNHIVIRHQIFGVGISRQLHSDSIHGVFVSRQRNDWFTYSDRGFRFADFKKGLVAINSGKTIFGEPQTFRFGSILNEAEAKQIVTMIHQRFLRYRYRHQKNAG